MSTKELVVEYYESGAYRTAEGIDRLIHDEVIVQWHSSKGYLQLEKNDILTFAAELDKSYSSQRLFVSHIISENDLVTVRYTHYVNPFESPADEMILAHFVVIWEVKDNQLYKGYLMSQLG